MAAAAASQNLGTTIAGFTGTGLQLGSTHNLGGAASLMNLGAAAAASQNLESIIDAAAGLIHFQNLGTDIAGFTGSGLQLGSTHNLMAYPCLLVLV